MPSRPLRVAMLVVDDRPDHDSRPPFFGAAPTALLQGFEALGRRQAEIHVVCCTKVAMPAPLRIAENIFYHQIVTSHWTYLRSLHAGPIIGVRRLLRKLSPDIVHSHGVERWCAMSGALCNYPAVLTIHGHLRLILRKAIMRPFFYWHLQMMLGEWAIRRHRGVICISSHIQRSLRKSARRTWLIPNAIRKEFVRTPTSMLTIGRCITRILVIGTITENKRPLELLRMFFNMHSSGASFNVRFIGHLNSKDKYGAAFGAMIQQAAALGFAEHSAPVDSTELIRELDNADALVHFPLEEAFGLVVAEALSRGLKVFASKVGGIVDIVTPVQDSVLISPENFRALERSIRQWLAADKTHSQAAASIAQTSYCPETIADQTLSAYRDVLELDAPAR
jgi:glycosyltransferase involved in cell wall biosynthesis